MTEAVISPKGLSTSFEQINTPATCPHIEIIRQCAELVGMTEDFLQSNFCGRDTTREPSSEGALGWSLGEIVSAEPNTKCRQVGGLLEEWLDDVENGKNDVAGHIKVWQNVFAAKSVGEEINPEDVSPEAAILYAKLSFDQLVKRTGLLCRIRPREIKPTKDW